MPEYDVRFAAETANIDRGEEFELALCQVLRTAIPQKYGICRGFVVNRAGDVAGDDTVIFGLQEARDRTDADADSRPLIRRPFLSASVPGPQVSTATHSNESW